MKKKADCEAVIRQLCSEYSSEKNIPMQADSQPSFQGFVAWVNDKGYGNYFNFRSTMGPMYDAETWFDQEFKQMWRN